MTVLVPTRTLEYLSNVPRDPIFMRVIVGTLRRSNLLSVICNDPFLKSPRAISVSETMTDMESENGKHAAVEKLMVERAQGEAVTLLVRTAGLMPLNVSGLDSNQNPSRRSKPHTAQLYS
jgi:hypothetical protein